jgi:hypothetical protein
MKFDMAEDVHKGIDAFDGGIASWPAAGTPETP